MKPEDHGDNSFCYDQGMRSHNAPGDYVQVEETDGKNQIMFDDRPYQCAEHDDYTWTACKAHSLGGTDEVLVIESGNRGCIGGLEEDPSSATRPKHSDDAHDQAHVHPSGFPAQPVSAGGSDPSKSDLLTPVTGESLEAEARFDDQIKEELNNFDTAVHNRLKQACMQSEGRDLAPLQEMGKGCKYKSHVVRRELVHGSYEEHIEGDKYTTIEGTWFSTIKGHLWNTYYGKTHDDFLEDYAEVFRGSKTEINLGPILEINKDKTTEHCFAPCEEHYHDSNSEYYYGNVMNTYGGVDPVDGIKKTPQVEDWYYGRHKTQHEGKVEDWYFDDVKECRCNTVNYQHVMGIMISTIMTISLSTVLGIRIDISPAVDVEFSLLKFGNGLLNLAKDKLNIKKNSFLDMTM